MKKIPLHGKHGQGKFTLVDDDDFEELSKEKWLVGSTGYVISSRRVEGKNKFTLMHRKIMQPGEGLYVDHINLDKLDNRKGNLRIATNAENVRNGPKRSNTSSPYKGVFWHKQRNKWRAEITKDYQNISLGLFDDPIKAAKAYDYMAHKLFGEFARFNFPDDSLEEFKIPVLKSNNKSGYRGVSWNKSRNKWISQISKNKQRFMFGYFDCKHEAARAYNAKALELYGEKALLNEIQVEEESA